MILYFISIEYNLIWTSKEGTLMFYNLNTGWVIFRICLGGLCSQLCPLKGCSIMRAGGSRGIQSHRSILFRRERWGVLRGGSWGVRSWPDGNCQRHISRRSWLSTISRLCCAWSARFSFSWPSLHPSISMQLGEVKDWCWPTWQWQSGFSN